MSDIIIEAKNLCVEYVTGDLRNIGLKEYIVKKISRKYKVNRFMAVNDVSFTVHQGDLIGVIGANGAGKSTLMKVISQILRPRSGSLTINGKVNALLELGGGFDGELTLKENAYLRGAMLGFDKKYMDEIYPKIVEFTDVENIEQYLFKQLSSGMLARVAFSIACMMEPEILILDEVLAVGDGHFRKKSEQKMHEIISKGKATILVSHSIPQIRRMCNKVLWLDKGKQIAFGDTEIICDRYEEFIKTGLIPEYIDGSEFSGKYNAGLTILGENDISPSDSANMECDIIGNIHLEAGQQRYFNYMYREFQPNTIYSIEADSVTVTGECATVDGEYTVALYNIFTKRFYKMVNFPQGKGFKFKFSLGETGDNVGFCVFAGLPKYTLGNTLDIKSLKIWSAKH